MSSIKRHPQLIAALVIGLGLALAPVAFQMFTRAPEGATMIEEFDPYMTPENIEEFQGYLAQIAAAESEVTDRLRPTLAASGLDAAAYDAAYPSATALNSSWTAIDDDMSDLLNTMDENLDNFADIKALPSFNLFAWFFLVPGLFIAGVAIAAIRAPVDSQSRRRLLLALGGLGVALVLAPVVFQMFTRAPSGGEMINDFRPMMTRERVIDVQGYFITLGAAEGELRNKVMPAAAETAGTTLDEVASTYPATSAFSDNWPVIVGDFAPMIAVMSDNVDNYEAVDALPPFALFPWFFVVPGVLVAGLAWSSARRHPGDDLAPTIELGVSDRADALATQGAKL